MKPLSAVALFTLYRLPPLAIVLALFATPAAFGDEGPPEREYVETDEPWQEIETELPAFPKASQFHRLPSQIANTALAIHIDPASISRGSDGVVRYSLAIRSPAGAENVYYEGIRCETGEYKSYAYGTTEGAWSRLDNAAWQPVSPDGSARFRRFVYRHYLCSPAGGGLSEAQMKRNVRYGTVRREE